MLVGVYGQIHNGHIIIIVNVCVHFLFVYLVQNSESSAVSGKV